MKIYKNKKFGAIILAAIFAFILLTIWQNNTIGITELEYKSGKVPEAFDGFRITAVSDLHNEKFGNNQSYLIEKLRKCKPDIIVVTGDLIDSRKTNISLAMEFINQAVQIAPVYYVTGNHEARIPSVYRQLEEQMKTSGVNIMNNRLIEISKGKDILVLIGCEDNILNNRTGERQKLETLTDLIEKVNTNKLSILLSHRPELIDIYSSLDIDLVFSGHAHGGQFRIPLIGGLAAPNQGFFPKYTAGLYKMNQTTMAVSRGLGNSIIPVRILNQPELLVVTLKRQQ